MTSILAAQQPPLMHQKICVPGEKTIASERQSGVGKNQQPRCLSILSLFTHRFAAGSWTRPFTSVGVQLPTGVT